MSRKRKRIVAATLLMASVLGLGLAGYIQVTRAKETDVLTAHADSSSLNRYRLNHQIGMGDSQYVWGRVANEYASSIEEDHTQAAHEGAGAGSNEPEDSEEKDAANAGKSHAGGAGANFVNNGHVPFGPGAGARGGDDMGAPSTFRLASTYSPGFAGGASGAGGGQQGAPQPNNEETNTPGDKTDKPAGTGPTNETGPKEEEPKNEEPKSEGPPPVTPPETGGPLPTDPKPPGDYFPPTDNKPVEVPEPATLGLLGVGLAAMGFMRRRRGQAAG